MTRILSPDQIRENIGIAVEALRLNKLRSGLTILGVVIGVATVMTMATIVKGIRDQILHTIAVAGPTTFYVMKIFSTTPINPDQLPAYVRIRPDLREAEAARIAQLPQIGYAAIWSQIQARLDHNGTRTRTVVVFGADDRYQELQGGELVAGRWFTRAELRSGAPVAVLQERHARQIFGRENTLEKT
ncbi:MAG TPA: ABC transporter permease, partial [Gemmatimonadaceae bacterium]|nr:ABC transporter permease [Gemmatimonadaceae bacterium]